MPESLEKRLARAEAKAGIGTVPFNPRTPEQEARAQEIFDVIYTSAMAGETDTPRLQKLWVEWAALPRLTCPAGGTEVIDGLWREFHELLEPAGETPEQAYERRWKAKGD